MRTNLRVAAISDWEVPEGGVHVVRMQFLEPLGQASKASAALDVVPTTTAAVAADCTKARRDEAVEDTLYASVVAAQARTLKTSCEIFMVIGGESGEGYRRKAWM